MKGRTDTAFSSTSSRFPPTLADISQSMQTVFMKHPFLPQHIIPTMVTFVGVCVLRISASPNPHNSLPLFERSSGSKSAATATSSSSYQAEAREASPKRRRARVQARSPARFQAGPGHVSSTDSLCIGVGGRGGAEASVCRPSVPPFFCVGL